MEVMDSEYVTVTVLRYCLALRREAWFRLTYQITSGPRPGIWRWFLVKMEEVVELGNAA